MHCKHTWGIWRTGSFFWISLAGDSSYSSSTFELAVKTLLKLHPFLVAASCSLRINFRTKARVVKYEGSVLIPNSEGVMAETNKSLKTNID